MSTTTSVFDDKELAAFSEQESHLIKQSAQGSPNDLFHFWREKRADFLAKCDACDTAVCRPQTFTKEKSNGNISTTQSSASET